MRPSLFTLLSAASLLLCLATAAAWVRGRSYEDWCSYTTSPYDNPVQHSASVFSENGRIRLELDSNYRPRLLNSSNGSLGFGEQFSENWGWFRASVPITPDIAPEPWPLWGGSGYGRPSRLGFAGEFENENNTIHRSVWIPFYFLFVITAIMPCLWAHGLWARVRFHRRRSRGLCPGCGYDLRASTARCPECGRASASVEEKRARRWLLPATVLLLLLAVCSAIGVFWHLDSRERPEAVLAPDAIPAALKPGMSESEVNTLTNRPHFGEHLTRPPETTCSLLSDGSTLVCNYVKRAPPPGYGGELTILQSFERLRFEELKPLLPADLFPAVRMIHLAPPGVANAFDPIALIRSVNALQRLGKEKALAALRAYVMLAGQDPKRAFRYDIDPRRPFLVARILFDLPKNEHGASAASADFPYANAGVNPSTWPQFPLVVQNDIPLCMDRVYEDSLYRDAFGVTGDIEAYLDRCQQSGMMRSVALSPTSTPLDALETLAKSERWTGRIFGDYDGTPGEALTVLRVQAIRAASALFINLKNEDWTCLEAASQETSDRIWSHFLQDERLKRMKWETEGQRFVISDR